MEHVAAEIVTPIAPTEQGARPGTDMLRTLVMLQGSMNNVAYNKQQIHSVATGKIMNTEAFFASLAEPDPTLTANSDTCVWLRNYIWAARKELEELEELVPKKWWSKNELDLEDAREEFIDVLHFMLSIGLALGLDAEGIMDVYRKKNEVNLQRQAQGYIARTNG